VIGATVITTTPGTALVPTYLLGYYNSHYWKNPNVFNLERFFHDDPDTGKLTFSLDGESSKFLPWEDRKAMCPGRVSAKQEAIGAVALILPNFDIEVTGFVNEKGRQLNHVPGFQNLVPGVGVISPGGELQVKKKRRTQTSKS